MPFTVSHVAAVLPLAVGAPARRLVPSALVIGSMVPDLPRFVPLHLGSGWTHAAYGPVTIDLAAGLVLVAVWHFLLHRPLVDFAPTWVGRRVSPPAPWPAERWSWVALSVVIGAYTHVILDTFTHTERWGTRAVPALNVYVGPLPVFQWLQFGLGIFGLLLVGIWAAVWLLRAVPRPDQTKLTHGERLVAWTAVAIVFAGTATATAVRGTQYGLSMESIAYDIATETVSLTAAVAICLCLVWQVDAALSRGSGQGPTDGAQGRAGEGPGDQPVGGRERRQ